jgi:hypothetical protein
MAIERPRRIDQCGSLHVAASDIADPALIQSRKLPLSTREQSAAMGRSVSARHELPGIAGVRRTLPSEDENMLYIVLIPVYGSVIG